MESSVSGQGKNPNRLLTHQPGERLRAFFIVPAWIPKYISGGETVIIKQAQWDQLSKKDRRLIAKYIRLLLWAQNKPRPIHAMIRGIGDLIFYRL